MKLLKTLKEKLPLAKEIPGRIKNINLKDKKTRKKIIMAAIAIAIIIALLVAFTGKGKKADKVINTAEVIRGDIRVTVSGSGTLEAIESYEVKSTVSGDVLTGDFNEGDKITKDQILYTIDTTEMENTIERAELSMQKTRDSYNSTLEDIAKLNVKAPINGVITAMYVNEGDSVSNGTKICEVLDNSKMILTIPFNTADAGSLYNGATASVTIDNSFYSTYGTVTRIASGTISNENNASITYVDITIDNPGGIKDGDTATAMIGDIACNSSGTFSCDGKKTVTAKVTGEVNKIYNDIGDYVYSGNTILTIESDSLNDTLKSSNISLRDAELSLENTYDKLNDYTIKAPIDGTVIYKNIKAGDTLDIANGATTLCYIADLSSIVFTLSVDELDILKIKAGQKAQITADSVDGRFSGTVTKVSINGTTVNGVTTYPVEITLDDPGELIPGMNVNADIIIEEKEDVLMVPVSAVMRGNVCYVEGKGKKAEKSEEKIMSVVPEGFHEVRVKTGVNSDDFIEITEGLKEGDKVYLRTASTTNFMFPGMSGGMGGGTPQGGGSFSGGGMSGNRMPSGNSMPGGMR